MNSTFIQHWSLQAERILLVLADVTFKSFLVFLIAGAFALALRRSSAVYRHLVWRLALGAMFLLPVLSAVMPSHEITAVSHVVQMNKAAVTGAVSVSPTIESARPNVNNGAHPTKPMSSKTFPDSAQVNGKLVPAIVSPIAAVPAPRELSLTAERQLGAVFVGAFSLLLAALWVVGVAIVAVPTGFALLNLRRLTRPLLPLSQEQSAQAAAAALMIVPKRPVCVRIASLSSPILVPMTWGFWHPIIALPADAAGWTGERLHAALLHELAHVRRGDWLAQVLASLACSLYWFNPLVWIAARMMRSECERAADDFAVTHGLDAPTYAGHLLEIALALRDRRRAPRIAVPMVRQSRIEARLRDILSPHPRQEMTAHRRVAALGVAACVMLVGSAFRFSEKVTDEPWNTRVDVASDAFTAPAAQSSVSLPNGAVVRIAGVVDTQVASPRSWSANGSPAASQLPKNTLAFQSLPAGAQGRAFAFATSYVPMAQPKMIWTKPPTFSYEYTPDTVHHGVYFKKPGNTWEFDPRENIARLDRDQEQESRQGAETTALSIAPQAFRTADKTCTAKFGVAAGPWTETVECLKWPGKTHISADFGEVIFTLIPNPHNLGDPRAVRRGNAVFMVTDHFDTARSASGAPAEYERSVLALDRSGHVVCDLGGTMMPEGDGKYEQMIHIPSAVLTQVVSFRLLARLYQWAEFKDVQLQPQVDTPSAAASQDRPDTAAAYVAFGQQLQQKGQPRDGIPEFRRAVRIDPNNAEAQAKLADALFNIKTKRFVTPKIDTSVYVGTPPAVLDEAVLHMRKAAALRPDDPWEHSTLASYLANRGHHVEAVAEYRRAMHLMPPLPSSAIRPSTDGVIPEGARHWYDAYWTLGQELVQTGQYQDAEVNLRQALRFYPSDGPNLLWLGDALNGEGRRSAAEAAWKESLKATPPNLYYQRQARARLAAAQVNR